MKVLVCGSRRWHGVIAVARELKKLPAGSIVIHGDGDGADTVAARVAGAMGYVVRSYPANWHTYGRAAGPLRNAEMIACEHRAKEPIAKVIAFSERFHKDFCPGTMDMIAKAERAGIVVERYSE